MIWVLCWGLFWWPWKQKFSQDAIFALVQIAVIKAKARIELGPTTAARRLQLDRSTSDSASRHSA